jgi:alkylhydroperoxidase family enzyme
MKDALTPLTPPGGPPKQEKNRSRGLGALTMFAHHPALAKAFFSFNGHILWDTTLTARQRQLLILRVATKRRSTYVWGEHVVVARDAGLSDEEISRVASGSEASLWEPLDGALLRAADELIDEGDVADDTWATLSSTLDARQLVDVVFTVGCYETTSLFFRTFGLEGDTTNP